MQIFKINKNAIKISSKACVYKTDKFIKQTQGILYADFILKYIYNAIIEDVLKDKFNLTSNQAILATTLDNQNKFFIKLGKQLGAQLNKADVVFYKYLGKEKKGRNSDKRFYNIVNSSNNFVEFSIKVINDDCEDKFNKLYIIANSDEVNMPLLNKNQEKIVKMEDNNVLVQGVAGSGKTNICIDKIVYGACRHYLGKTLYSTYSHSLLLETKKKVELLNRNIKAFIEKDKKGEVVYLDSNKKDAIEKYLGIYLNASFDNYLYELEQISQYLYEKVDYKLIENFIKDSKDKTIADEQYFIKKYIPSIKNYNLRANLEKLKHLSFEIIYKEIYGIIFGTFYNNNIDANMANSEYVELRKDSFTSSEANTIYMLAMDYNSRLKQNGILDNNIISRQLLNKINEIEKYSIVILDEVQDFTQVNLNFFKNITLKLFCVGDVLQMINPTYFSFAYLKRLMFKENLSSVIELKHNYRNSKKIERLIDSLSQLNIEQFGTHSFVIRGESIDSDVFTNAIYVNDGNLLNLLNKSIFYEFTIVVATQKKKEELLKIMPKQEILTVSEIKGLERTNIILYDILSDNSEKWNMLQRNIINKKKAEENSIFRYYFNLFYVGISRAKQNLFVVERKHIDLFDSYFKNGFEIARPNKAIEIINKVIKTIDIDEIELQKRIDEFIKLEQFDNARFNAEKLPDEKEKELQLLRISIFEKYVRKNEFKKAGIEFWKQGLFDDAKMQFVLSHDDKLIELIDACINSNGQKLEYDIVQFLPDVSENVDAVELIFDTLSGDVKNLKEKQSEIHKNIKNMKR